MSTMDFETSGKVKKPSAEQLLAADPQASILACTTGIMDDGQPYYAYIAVKPSMYEEFYALTSARQPLVLGDYGTVIAAGFGTQPPPEVAREMREQYGFDEHYLEKLQAEVNRQGKIFHEKKEEERLTGIVEMLKEKNGSGASAN